MSPYRVRVSKYGYGIQLILAAMMHVDKYSNYHEILIVAKAVPSDDNSLITVQSVAYSQTTQNNSVILDKYEIVRALDFSRYYLVRRSDSEIYLEDKCPTQQRCLKVAMEDYCERNNFTINEIL